MSTDRAATISGVMARAGLWSALAFALNLVWEIAHARLYTFWIDTDRMRIAWSLVHCTLGDVVIALAAFALAGLALRQADWPLSRPWVGATIVVIASTTYTAWSEWYNVYQTASWGYTASMPVIFGIGLSPLLQWLILPPVLTITYRMLCPRLFEQHAATGAIPVRDLSGIKK